MNANSAVQGMRFNFMPMTDVNSLWPSSTNLVETPCGFGIARERKVQHSGANEFDRHRAISQHRVVELFLGHLSRAHDFLSKRVQLQSADHIPALVKRR